MPGDAHHDTSDAPAPTILHASAVAVEGRAALLTGPSGSGKSALALQLMALGADLIADDRTVVEPAGGQLIASAPETIAGLIEARGLGILNARAAEPAPVAVIVDLGVTETERLPPPRKRTLQGVELPLLHKVESGHFTPALLQYLKQGRSDV